MSATECIAAALLACGLLSLLHGRDAVLRRGP